MKADLTQDADDAIAVGVFTLARLACLWFRARGTAWMRVGAQVER